LMALISILIFFVGLSLLPLEANSVLSFYSSNMILEFGAGALLGAAYVGRIAIGRKAATLCLLGGMLTAPLLPILDEGLPRAIQAGLPALLIVMGAVMLEEGGFLVQSKTLRRLGDASYSLYLSHGIVLSAASQIWRKIGASQIHGAYAAFIIAALLSSSVVALVIYRIIERPIISLFRFKLLLRPSGYSKIGYRI
jgi:exopolysaccharide production protein ExoZ